MKGKVKILCLSAAVCLLFGGCGQKQEEAKTENVQNMKKPTIGFSIDSLILERWQKDRDVFVSAAQNLGAEVNVQNANGNTEEQIAQIEYFIEKQMDAIVIIPGNKDAMTDVVRRAKDAGIPVISYDRVIANADCDMHISFDNQEVGELMAQGLMESIPDGGDIFLIQGPEADNNVKLVKEGFDRKNQDSGLHVVFEANCDGWLPENAVDSVREALDLYPDVAGIMCGNDELAGKVFQILAEKQLAGKVAMVGQDCDLAACQRIVEGSQTMTVFKDIDLLARTAAEYAVRFAKGEGEEIKSELRQSIPDGSYKVPYLEIPVTAVTKENMDEVIIQGGFHVKEDVYLNVKENE